MTVADAAAATIAAVSHAASSGGDTHAMVSKIILQLLLAFAAAKITGYIFEKINQPVVIGELLAGVIMGPYVLNVLQLNDPSMHLTFEVIAEVAVILLLFSIGLETKLSDMAKVGLKAFWVALAG
ncbi:MAG TPA: cation:proton antiporter, partial [Candidatus Goldiibacteriota bacterium]|nr:cation:proton antiporter [Candidatus Goldiibacteriota bacterium]